MGEQKASLAEQWRRKTKEKRRGKAVPLLLPSGMTVMISRPPIETWFGTAKLPEHLSKIVVDVFSVDLPEQMQEKMESFSDEDNTQIIAFFNRLLIEGVTDPTIVDKSEEELADSEYALADIDEEDRASIIYNLLQGVPTQPIDTVNGGEVSMEALETFRSGSGSISTGEIGGEVHSPS